MVPVAVAVGWELALGPRVVVVREVRPTTVIVVDSAGGAPEEIEIQREDNAENMAEEAGSELAAGDASPGRESEEDVEEEVDE